MKGSSAVLVCLGIWTICISGQIPRVFAADAAIAEGKGPTDHVVQLNTEDAAVMNCELDPQDGVFTAFSWKKDTTKAICDVATTGGDCTITDTTLKLKAAAKKYNLLSDGKVEYIHAGKYGCTFTPGTGGGGGGGGGSKFTDEVAQLTVVGATTCDPSGDITIKKEDEANLTCSVEYDGTTPKLSIGDTELEPSEEDVDGHKKLTGTMTVKPTEVGDKEYTCKTTFTGLTYTDVGCKIKVTVEEKDGDNAAVGLESKLGLTVLTCFTTLWLSQKNLL